jgi:hypothetical protein
MEYVTPLSHQIAKFGESFMDVARVLHASLHSALSDVKTTQDLIKRAVCRPSFESLHALLLLACVNMEEVMKLVQNFRWS